MKKLLYIALFLLTTFFLVGCDQEYSFSLDATVVAVRDSITVEYTLNDPEKELSSSEVKAELATKENSKVVSTKTLSFDKETKKGSVKFSSLESKTSYVLTIYAGYDGEKVVLFSKEEQTLDQGADEETPYEISSAEDFEKYVKNDNKGYFKLLNDIDLEGKTYTPFFTSTTQFLGHFDGNGHKIKNYIVGTKSVVDGVTSYGKTTIATDYYGLFGYIGEGGIVTNVTLENFQFHAYRVSSSKTYYGLIAGYCKGTISNVKVVNSLMNLETRGATSEYHIAALVGQLTGTGVISNCTVDCDIKVNGKNNVKLGGIVASTLGSTAKDAVSNCNYTLNRHCL